ncbi:MAG: hypothetical protein HYU52_06555 [Acidobacteria bacterium]|nr:hypothetical protein [Acidobacteriota bacterium]
MNFLRLVPAILSTLVLGAHFFRGGNLVVVAAVLVLLILLIVRRPWVAYAYQLLLLLGAIEWLRTLVEIMRRRQAMGEPWTRMAIILGAVAVITAASALVFRMRPLRERYQTL